MDELRLYDSMLVVSYRRGSGVIIVQHACGRWATSSEVDTSACQSRIAAAAAAAARSLSGYLLSVLSSFV